MPKETLIRADARAGVRVGAEAQVGEGAYAKPVERGDGVADKSVGEGTGTGYKLDLNQE